MTSALEINFDGIVGPTYNYGGLSYGNLASMIHGGAVSNPRKAALQGLDKMRLLMDLGVKQALLPPQERPHLESLRRLGFVGSDEEVITRAGREAPGLLVEAYSASSMWAANAATLSPSADCLDGRVHITPANLTNNLHRSLETSETARILDVIFPDEKRFARHPPLPSATSLSDEGAANHFRLCAEHGDPGVEVFVYGRKGLGYENREVARFPSRQTREASEAVARLHRLPKARTLFVRQNPALIDAGVFHNDVICVSNEYVLFFHTSAFSGGDTTVEKLRRHVSEHCDRDLVLLSVSNEELSPVEAVDTYLFNSQIVTLPDASMVLVAPMECRVKPRAKGIVDRILSDGTNPIRSVRYVPVRESMRNGGGPACLRLRAVLTEDEIQGVHPGVLLSPRLYNDLRSWILRWYRTNLSSEDLLDPSFSVEVCTALDELTQLLDLGSIYRFQREAGSGYNRAHNRLEQ